MPKKNGVLKAIAGTAGLGAAAYLIYAGKTWLSYGRPAGPSGDDLLDRFMPDFHVREHHRVRVAAPAEAALRAATDLDMSDSRIANALFEARRIIMRGPKPLEELRGGMLAVMRCLGWVTLSEVPGREIVLGTGAQPWLAEGKFRSIPADEFRAFRGPRYVKIALTLKAEPISASECHLSTETRAVATDDYARERFRVYWAFLSPGIRLLRWPMLARAKKIAERRQETGKIAA